MRIGPLLFLISHIEHAFFALAPVAWRARALAQLAEGAMRQTRVTASNPSDRPSQATEELSALLVARWAGIVI